MRIAITHTNADHPIVTITPNRKVHQERTHSYSYLNLAEAEMLLADLQAAIAHAKLVQMRDKIEYLTIVRD